MAADPDFRPWDELVPDALGLIFSKLNNGKEVLQVIPLVCKWWCQVVEGPYCWQRIDTRHFFPDRVPFLVYADEAEDEIEVEVEIENDIVKAEQVLRALLPRSLGSLCELYVSCTDDYMLSFIAEHAGSLETLRICIRAPKESTFEQFATNLGTLTKLVVIAGMSQPMLEAIGKNCQRLVSLTWGDGGFGGSVECRNRTVDEDVFVWSMPNLKQLILSDAVKIRDSCIFSLLSGSPVLESVYIEGVDLDPRVVKEKCPNIVTLTLVGNETVDSGIDEDENYDSEEYESYDDE